MVGCEEIDTGTGNFGSEFPPPIGDNEIFRGAEFASLVLRTMKNFGAKSLIATAFVQLIF